VVGPVPDGRLPTQAPVEPGEGADLVVEPGGDHHVQQSVTVLVEEQGCALVAPAHRRAPQHVARPGEGAQPGPRSAPAATREDDVEGAVPVQIPDGLRGVQHLADGGGPQVDAGRVGDVEDGGLGVAPQHLEGPVAIEVHRGDRVVDRSAAAGEGPQGRAVVLQRDHLLIVVVGAEQHLHVAVCVEIAHRGAPVGAGVQVDLEQDVQRHGLQDRQEQPGHSGSSSPPILPGHNSITRIRLFKHRNACAIKPRSDTMRHSFLGSTKCRVSPDVPRAKVQLARQVPARVPTRIPPPRKRQGMRPRRRR